MTLPTFLAVMTLVVGVPLNLYVVVKLGRLYRASHIAVLRERGIVATVVLVIVIAFGLIFMNNDLPAPLLAGDVTKYITRLAVLALAVVPAAYWLWIYRKAGR